jgi:DNA/RNA endonuclease G (NUC1)
MDRFFYYLLGALIALVLTLGAISWLRSSGAEALSPEPVTATAKATPSPGPSPASSSLLPAETGPNSPPLANMPSLINATPEPSPTPAPVPWAPPYYGKTTALTYPGFTVIYSTTLGNPLAVQYAMVGGAKPRRWPDPPKVKTPASALITQNGYSRGAMALTKSISLYFGKQAGKNTDLMTNSSPFNPATLTGPWAQFSDLEPKWAGEAGWIETVAGPIFGNPASQTASGLVVPVAFYRAYRRSYGDTIAFIIPQNATDPDLKKYITSIAVIEAATGVAIFTNTIPDEQRSAVATAVW